MAETERGLHTERKRERGIIRSGTVPMRDRERLKSFSPFFIAVAHFLLFIFSRSYPTTLSFSRSWSAQDGPHSAAWNQPGNCSLERVRQPAFFAFAFLPGAISRDLPDLPLYSRACAGSTKGSKVVSRSVIAIYL